MLKLNFDTGVKKFQINNGAVLQFNPSDINVYLRFMEAADKLQAIESSLVKKGEGLDPSNIKDVMRLMGEADAEVKKLCDAFPVYR